MASKEALDVREGETAHPNTPGQKQKAARHKQDNHFHNVKECFKPVCDEIEEDLQEQSRKYKQDLLDGIVDATWPDNPEKCWTQFNFWQCSLIKAEFLHLLHTTRPHLGKYLSDRSVIEKKEKATSTAKSNEKAVDNAVNKIKMEWSPAQDDDIKHWYSNGVPQELEASIAKKLPKRFQSKLRLWQAAK